jgi:hypothetical protein
MQAESEDQVKARFDSTQLVQVQTQRIHEIRETAKALAVLIHRELEVGGNPRYVALAKTELEVATMWAVKAVAHGE